MIGAVVDLTPQRVGQILRAIVPDYHSTYQRVTEEELARHSAIKAAKEYRRGNIVERYFKHVVENSVGCWGWSGAQFPPGYGHLSGAEPYAHHIAFALFYGFLPERVCHTCDNPPCTRPDHLFAGTPKSNTHDSIRKGRFHRWRSTGVKLNGDPVHATRFLSNE